MSDAAAVRRHMETTLGLEVLGFERLGVTAYNRHYRVDLPDGPLHLVVYTLPEALPLQGIRFEHALLRHLGAAGYASTPTLHAHDDETLFRVGDDYYALTAWIEGCHQAQDIVVTPAQLTDAAHVLAAFHRATEGLDLRLDYFPEHVFVYPLPAFLDAHEQLLAGLRSRVAADVVAFDNTARANLERFAPRALRFFGELERGLYGRVRAADPTGIVHGDFRRINLVFGEGERVRWLLDYNCCFNEIRLWDVAYAALSFGGKETVGPVDEPAQASAFLRAYDRVSPLSDDERELLPAFLAYVVGKLATAAMASWWINERVDTFERLLDGQAEDIVRAAFDEPVTGEERDER